MIDGLHIRKRTMKPLAIALSGQEGGQGGELVRVIKPMYNISPFGIVTIPPVQRLYLNKFF
jgi:hypothetical protein